MATIDFSKALVDLKGEPLKTDEGELTLERVAVSALLQPAKDETGESKYKKYGLIKQIHGATEPVDLKSEDIASIKRAIGESSFTAMVTGQAWDMLEGQ
jgi:hypothetical protein